MGGGSSDTSGQDAAIAQQNRERANKLKSLEEQRFAIIKSEGAPIWNSIHFDPGQEPTDTKFVGK